MKFGYRKPNLKKSIKARTTGKIKRSVRKSINPVYGQNGIGYAKNPKKAIQNSIYHKTTFDITKSIKNTILNTYSKPMNNKKIDVPNDKNIKTTTATERKEKIIIPLSPTQDKIANIISIIIAILFFGFIGILIVSFIVGLIQGLINNL
jgi:hypothetical protein